MFQVGGGCPPLQEKEDTVLYQRGVDEMRSAVGAVVGGGEFVSCEAVMCSTVGQLGWAHLPVLVHVLRPDSMRFVEVTRDRPGSPGYPADPAEKSTGSYVQYVQYSRVSYGQSTPFCILHSLLRQRNRALWLALKAIRCLK
jgi:hypothetical protein